MGDLARRNGMIVLASASPRRAQWLERIGVPFVVRPVAIDESPRPGEPATAYVLRLAREKAAAATGDRVVLAADTAVSLDGRIFGKPRDERDGIATLLALSGREHEVFTALAARSPDREACRLASATVTFRAIGPAEAAAYWRTGEPADKAGSYGMQGMGGVFVSRIDGSPGAVVGLPLPETHDMLASFGIPCWSASSSRTA